MKFYILSLVAVLFLQDCAGLECWTCDNQPSIFHCMFIGNMKTCLINQRSCFTRVRRCGTKLAVTKGCKQTQACLTNARLQVTPVSFGIIQCNTNQESSVCDCCCQGEKCNLNSNKCNGMSFDCEARGSITNGEVSCSRGKESGSVCRFNCTIPDEVLFPFDARQSSCLQYGQWNRPLPCCTRPCPPFLLNDVLFMSQASSLESWQAFQQKVVAIGSQLQLGNDSTRVGVLSYGSRVHTDRAIFLPEFMENRLGFLEKVTTLPYTADSGGILAGEALAYVLLEYFTPERGDRPNVTNVIVVRADNASTDDVFEITEELRQREFQIYAIGSAANTNPIYRQQLLEIAGNETRVYFESDADDFSVVENLLVDLCGDPCAISAPPEK